MISTRTTLRSTLAAFSVAALVLVGCDEVDGQDDLVDDPANDMEETDEFDDDLEGEDDDFEDEDDFDDEGDDL